MHTEVQQENKMGVMPVNRLLISMSLPMMISMLVQALYNVVDSIFVAQIHKDALTAVSLAFPLQSLMIAVCAGTGVGINAILSRALGAGDRERANRAAGNGVFLAVLSYIVFCILGFVAVKPFYASQTDDIMIAQYGRDYLSIVMILSFGFFMQMTFERLLQATGKTLYTMFTQGTGAIINLILDPILIFGYCGLPRMEVRGAALATVIGQMVAGLMAIVINAKKNKEIQLNIRRFRPSGKIIAAIYKVGIPSIIMQAIGSLMTYGMNRILIGLEMTGATVFGVYFKMQSFVFMPIFGMNNGVVPIIAYNYGAGKRSRMIRTIRYAIVYAFAIMLVGLLIFQIFPEQLLRLFNADALMLEYGVPALRIISIHFPVAAICIILGTVFQALGHAFYSLIVSVARQIVVLLPAAYLLSLTGRVTAVWWSFPIAEVASLTITLLCFVNIYRKVIRKVPDAEA